MRVDVTLGGAGDAWVTPASFAVSAAPAFRTKAGRTVVLALTNRAGIAEVFHLHGHHFRLLDRLDDGWKPFWLGYPAYPRVEPGRTQPHRLCALSVSGNGLMEQLSHQLGGAAFRCGGMASKMRGDKNNRSYERVQR